MENAFDLPSFINTLKLSGLFKGNFLILGGRFTHFYITILKDSGKKCLIKLQSTPMDKDYDTKDQMLMNWVRVGWIVNAGLALVLLVFSNDYARAGICFLSSVTLSMPYFIANKWFAARITIVIYMLLCFTEWHLLSYSIIDVEKVLLEGRAYSFLINILVLIIPMLYAALRWIFGVLMIMALWKERQE